MSFPAFSCDHPTGRDSGPHPSELAIRPLLTPTPGGLVCIARRMQKTHHRQHLDILGLNGLPENVSKHFFCQIERRAVQIPDDCSSHRCFNILKWQAIILQSTEVSFVADICAFSGATPQKLCGFVRVRLKKSRNWLVFKKKICAKSGVWQKNRCHMPCDIGHFWRVCLVGWQDRPLVSPAPAQHHRRLGDAHGQSSPHGREDAPMVGRGRAFTAGAGTGFRSSLPGLEAPGRGESRHSHARLSSRARTRRARICRPGTVPFPGGRGRAGAGRPGPSSAWSG